MTDDVTIVRLPLTMAAERGIRIDGGTQSRTALHQATVDEYAEAIKTGATMPPVVVFDDGENLWLADGFHRYHAHLAAEATGIDCEVYEGSQRDAILHSLRANAIHGLRRSNEDKRKAVKTMLADAEWSIWPNVAIAKACGVSDHFVGAMRKSILDPIEDSQKPAKRKVTRNGKTFEQTPPSRPKAVPDANVAAADAPAPSVATPPETADTTPSAVIIDSELLREVNRVLALEAENAELKERLAEMTDDLQRATDDNELMRKSFEADDQLAAALKQLQQSEDLVRGLQSRIDGLMNEKNEMIRRYKGAKRDLEKLQKDLPRAA